MVDGAPAPPDELVLAAEFPAATREEWVALVDGVLRRSGRIGADAPAGAGVDKLVRHTYDGILVPPLFTAADAPDPGRPDARDGAWDVRQRVTTDDHADVLAELENGASSVWLSTSADLAAVLDGVLLDLAPVVLDTGGADTGAAEAFLALPGDPAARLGTLGLDPVGRRARTGAGPDVASVVPLARRVAGEFPRVRAIVVDAVAVHTAGGSDAQELGFSVAAGVAYLRALTGGGLDIPTAARLLEFRYAATAEQFPTIAKLRAARRLWTRVTDACGAAQRQQQHAVASPTMATRRDPSVNLLRGTVAGFAAGIGGADAVTVAPFDTPAGTPFSRRIARNTQSLLVMEAHLARVADAAGGSWYVESLTDALARAAWAFFQEIEAAGGAVAALDAGLVAARVAAVRAARERDAATRRAPITGVSEFPDLDEPPAEAGGDGPRAAGSGERDSSTIGTGGDAAADSGRGLPVWRPSAAYEAWRDRSDAVLADTGARPAVFLATLGPLAAYSARAGFTRNLLAAGGIAALEAGPTQTAEEVAAAYREHPRPVAVLCSTDGLYGERGAATVAALREAGAERILLAGRADVPGVDGQLYAGCDALAVIVSIWEVSR